MKIIDLHDPLRVSKGPTNVKILLSDGVFIQDEFKIFKIEIYFI